jgi:hypothetical protein
MDRWRRTLDGLHGRPRLKLREKNYGLGYKQVLWVACRPRLGRRFALSDVDGKFTDANEHPLKNTVCVARRRHWWTGLLGYWLIINYAAYLMFKLDKARAGELYAVSEAALLRLHFGVEASAPNSPNAGFDTRPARTVL